MFLHFAQAFQSQIQKKVLARGVGYQYQAHLIDYTPLKYENRGTTQCNRRLSALCLACTSEEQERGRGA